MSLILHGKNSFPLWAEEAGFMSHTTLSKQGVWKRINSCFAGFVLLVLNEVFEKHIKQTSKKIKTDGVLKNYGQILIQDSTILMLPDCLNKIFPGNYSKGKIKSLLKIQLTIDARKNKIVDYQLTSYSKNDQSMSDSMIALAAKEDMVIRDLGYFSLGVFAKLIDKGVALISRIKPGVQLFDTKTKQPINLLKLLKNKCQADLEVLVGKEFKLKMRLVALQLPEDITNEKIRKAKHNRNKRLNHSKEYYQLLRYNIYITSESKEKISTPKVAAIYRLRWRIETIFKSWKSHFNLQNMIPSNVSMTEYRAKAIIYLLLIFIMQFQMTLYHLIIRYLHKCNKPASISLMKFSKYIVAHLKEILTTSIPRIAAAICYYCCYDKRYDKNNYVEQFLLC